MKKVFVGLPVGSEFAKAVETWRRSQGEIPVRWLEDENMHATILPPWDEADVAGASERLRRAVAGSERFDIPFKGIEWGTSRWWPRLIWLVGSDSAGFERLRAACEREFGRKANKPFLPHVTLARVARGDERREFPMLPGGAEFEFVETPNTVALYESLGGSRYARLAEFPLAR